MVFAINLNQCYETYLDFKCNSEASQPSNYFPHIWCLQVSR